MMDSSYPWLWSLNVANFVTAKPCLVGDEKSSSFKIWRKQMLCLLESQDVVGFVDGSVIPPADAHQQKLWRRTDSLIQGWILGSIGNDALHAVWEKQTARDIWLELDNIFNDQQGEEKKEASKVRETLTPSIPYIMDSYPFPWLSAVNVGNFVTVKPCIEEEDDTISTFKIWKEQMLCLLESHDVVGFVDGGVGPPAADEQKLWSRTDRLVKGWILGSIGRDAVDAVWEKKTARDVWAELENIFRRKEANILSREEAKIFSRIELENIFSWIEAAVADNQITTNGDYSRYLPLYQAAQRGDWETAKNFFQDINQLGTTIISSDAQTPLHVAVLTGKVNYFVKKLVELVPREALKLKDHDGDTALHYAAIVGNTEAVKLMVNKNPDLVYIENDCKELPVRKAAIFCQKDTLEFLISKYEPNAQHTLYETREGCTLLSEIIASEFLDVALDLAEKYPNLAILRDKDGDSALSTIAMTGTLFPILETFTWWEKIIYHRIPLKKPKCEASRTTSVAGDIENSSKDGAAQNYSMISGVWQEMESMIWNVIKYLVPRVKELRNKKATHQAALQLADYLCRKLVSLPENEATIIFRRAIEKAAKCGLSEIVEMIIHYYPPVTFHRYSDGRNVFLLAASYRFENIINLIYNISDRKYMVYDCIDYQKNNLMHICGKLAPPDRLNLAPGAALQMQRELQWFKEMEKFVHPSRRTWPNKEKQTPQMIFTKEHESLKAEGERWMKDTANACTIAAALIATVMFAAAFTVPGGLESASGVPLFSAQPAFDLFAVSDAISLFTSIYSLLMFLSILTSRYAEEDFLYVLPKRLSIGLLSLFVSITFMMVAFCASFYLVFHRDGAWYQLVLAAFACLPATSFVLLQFPLLVDVVWSTYGPGIFGKKSDSLLY